jgi:hypothetical protein
MLGSIATSPRRWKMGSPDAYMNRGEYNQDQDYSYKFTQILADIPILKAALDSFFIFYFPKEEKRRIGFESE